ncbi:MAG: ABC transporter permease [Methanomicrobiaceae archaeon]|uniref:ABC transporter permease n=1 Tax=Methanoculleus sp. TaxID=90427 RepID=UPI00320FAA35|nr:ABC transporter permease [Methanomicrobiaceae archaeon]
MIFLPFAVRNLRRHWFRSLLSVIGIVVGVAAIASLGILGGSINLLVANLISDVGDTLVITPHTAIGGTFAGDPRTAVDTTLSSREVDDIRRAASPYRAIPVLQGVDEVEFGRGESGYTRVIGLDPEEIPILLKIENGRYPRQNQPGALVGTYLAREYGLRPGSRITIGGEDMRVAGVLAERGFAIDINPDYAIIVPEGWYTGHSGTRDGYAMAIVRVGDITAIDEVKDAVDTRLNRREDLVDIVDSREMLGQYRDIYGQITVFLLGIGGISLLVAAVNILNVMYIAVTERVSEIGVMRSIGVRRSEVLRIFLYEALVLGVAGSAVGGVISVVVGYVVSVAAIGVFTAGTTFGEEFVVFNLTAVGFIIFGIAFGIGTSALAGLYPAWKASRLLPVEAMRHA